MRTSRAGMLGGAAALLAIALAPDASARSNGGPPFTSGGPFPGEASCARCHRGDDPNSGPGNLQLLAGETPVSEFRYTPGELVSFIVEISDEDAARIGFQLTVRSGDGCVQPGSLAAGSSDDGSTVRTRTGMCSSNGAEVQWATHRRPVTGSTARFEVAWTPPAESVGPVTVAVAANAANGDQSVRGDRVYTLHAVMEAMEAPSEPPMISEGGVVLADLVSKTAKGAPNALAVASGTNFAMEGSTTLATVDADGAISTNLGGTCVEVNQQRAPILHLLPDQAHFQIPADAGLGPATVQVIRGCDTPEESRSNLSPFEIAAVQPVFLVWSEDPPIAAVHQDFALVAATDAIEGRESRPALPGDRVTLFGTGFGPVDPAMLTGEIAQSPRFLTAEEFRPMIGEFELADADIGYAGAAPGFAGLYQVDVTIPETVPAGPHAFSVLLDGVQSAAGPMLEVGLPAEPEVAECVQDLVVKPGESCTATVLTIEVVLAVDEEGRACVIAEASDFELCGTESLPLASFGASVVKNDDGSWTIVRLP